MCSDGDVLVSESDQEIHESELADRSLFVQELLLLAVTAADEGLLPENPVSETTLEIPSCEATTPPLLNSVDKRATNSDTVVNCSTKTGYLRGKNSAGLPQSGVGKSTGSSQRNLASHDGAKR